MTDPRLDDQLLAAIQRLPASSGIIFRHYHLSTGERRALFARVRRICVQRGHVLLLAGDAPIAHAWLADGMHGRGRCRLPILHSAPVHNVREIAEAKRSGADVLFLSPLRTTRSHPGARALGPMQFNKLAKLCHPAKAIALGGMNRADAAKWPRKIVYGWAAIDAFRI